MSFPTRIVQGIGCGITVEPFLQGRLCYHEKDRRILESDRQNLMQDLGESTNEEREQIILRWRTLEKRGKRFGGLWLVFGGALVLALEQGSESWVGLCAALLIAGGFTLILQSGTPQKRASIHFSTTQQQASRALLATIAAAFLLFQAFQQQRAIFWIGGLQLIPVIIWYRWREHLLVQFDRLFARQEEVFGDESAE